jgi:apolipoprotein N-acyltransferase
VNLFPTAFVAVILGGASVLGWAPWAWWPVALLSYAGLFYLLTRERGAVRATVIGLAFGVGLHAAGHGWVFEALHTKAGLGWMQAALSAATFVVYLALFTALPCGLFSLLRSKQRPGANQDSAVRPQPYRPMEALLLAVSFASLISAGEYARSLFFNGFTSLSLGYALVDTWLAGLGPMAGVYLVSWSGFCCAALIVFAVQGDLRWRVAVAGLVFAISATSGYLSGAHWLQPVGSAMSYRLLQVNVPQHRKFDPAHAQEHVQRLIELIERRAAELIVTPETAFPQIFTQLPDGVLARLRAFGQGHQSHLLLGIATTAANSEGHNSVLHLAPAAAGTGPEGDIPISQYHKVRLMPFGEYSPWGFAWFTRDLAVPLKDLSAGPANQVPFRVGPQRFGILICDEDLLGEEARRWVRDNGGASILINPSNLAWFEGSLAIEQRLQIVRMRAMEVGRPILRVANTGVTAHIDQLGRVVDRLAAERQDELTGTVQGYAGLTPYARGGDAAFLCLIFLCILSHITYITSQNN